MIKKYLLIIVCFLYFQESNAQIEWARSLDGQSFMVDKAFGITKDNDNNVYVTGGFLDTVDFDPGPGTHFVSSEGNTQDIFVLKLSENGDFQWVYTVGSFNNEAGFGITTDNDGNVLVTGIYGGQINFDPNGSAIENTNGMQDAFVLKINSNGDFIWVKTFGGNNNEFTRGICTDNNGEIYVVGTTYNDSLSPIDFDPNAGVSNVSGVGLITSTNNFVLNLDSSGQYHWAHIFGSLGFDYISSITALGQELIMGGSFESTTDFDFGPNVEQETNNQGEDLFLLKTDLDGNYVWHEVFKTPGTATTITSVDYDNSGNIYFTGYYSDSLQVQNQTFYSEGLSDMFVGKMDGSGSLEWLNSYGGTGNDLLNSVSLNNTGEVFAAGMISSEIDFQAVNQDINYDSGADLIFLKLNSTGDESYAKSVGGAANEEATAIISNDDGSFYSTGMFQVNVDFDSDTLSSVAQSVFILKSGTFSVSSTESFTKDLDFKIYPNPTFDHFYVDTKENTVELSIIDTKGKIYTNRTINHKSKIRVDNLENGVYYVIMVYNGTKSVQKLVKQ